MASPSDFARFQAGESSCPRPDRSPGLDPRSASATRHSPNAKRPTAVIHSMTVPPVWPASVARAPDWSALPPDPSAMRRMMYATIRCRTPLAAKPARAVYSNAVLSVALSTTPLSIMRTS